MAAPTIWQSWNKETNWCGLCRLLFELVHFEMISGHYVIDDLNLFSLFWCGMRKISMWNLDLGFGGHYWKVLDSSKSEVKGHGCPLNLQKPIFSSHLSLKAERAYMFQKMFYTGLFGRYIGFGLGQIHINDLDVHVSLLKILFGSEVAKSIHVL